MLKEKTPEETINEMKEREAQIYKRCDSLFPINENVVCIYRIDIKQSSTFLITDSNADRDRIRESWYGKVVLVSDVSSGDDIIDLKRKLLKRGDVITYNPESAYSLNVAEFPEIWVLHINNVLFIDNGYDPILAKEAALKRMYEREQNFINEKVKKAQLIKEMANMASVNSSSK
jgi:hypothetical protein